MNGSDRGGITHGICGILIQRTVGTGVTSEGLTHDGDDTEMGNNIVTWRRGGHYGPSVTCRSPINYLGVPI